MEELSLTEKIIGIITFPVLWIAGALLRNYVYRNYKGFNQKDK